jgi:hypothetical protein
VGELIWRQHSRPRLHRMLTLRSPSGTLGMGLASRVTMRVVVTIPLIVTLSLASELVTPLERYISYGVDQAERAVEGIR